MVVAALPPGRGRQTETKAIPCSIAYHPSRPHQKKLLAIPDRSPFVIVVVRRRSKHRTSGGGVGGGGDGEGGGVKRGEAFDKKPSSIALLFITEPVSSIPFSRVKNGLHSEVGWGHLPEYTSSSVGVSVCVYLRDRYCAAYCFYLWGRPETSSRVTFATSGSTVIYSKRGRGGKKAKPMGLIRMRIIFLLGKKISYIKGTGLLQKVIISMIKYIRLNSRMVEH